MVCALLVLLLAREQYSPGPALTGHSMGGGV